MGPEVGESERVICVNPTTGGCALVSVHRFGKSPPTSDIFVFPGTLMAG